MEYLDFELHVRPGDGEGQYVVCVARSPIIGNPEVAAVFPYTEAELQQRIGGVRRALHGTHRGVVVEAGAGEATSVEVVKGFGRDLFEFLINPEIRLFYDNSVAQARKENKGLRLRLRIDAPELAALPWEFLYNPQDTVDDFVSFSKYTPVVRHFDLSTEVAVQQIEPPLRILAMCADPSDRAQLDSTDEKAKMKEALRPLTEAGLVELRWLKGKTAYDLQVALGQGPWHIFHFIGHGGFDAEAGEGLLVLEDEAGRAAPFSAENLVRYMRDEPALQLVVLNACSGAEGSDASLFSSTASALSRRNVPAVVAMQFEVTDAAAIGFTKTFYSFLAQGMPVDSALAEARKGMATGGTLEWATPVLYLRSSDGKLFDVPEGMREEASRRTKTFQPYVPAAEPQSRGDGAPEPAPVAEATEDTNQQAGEPSPAPTAPTPALDGGGKKGGVPWTWVGVGVGVLAVAALALWWLAGSVPVAYDLAIEERNPRIEMSTPEARLNLIVKDEFGVALPVFERSDYPVVWSSSDTAVAQVEGRFLPDEQRLAGFFVPQRPGTTTIRAMLNDSVATQRAFTVLVPRETLAVVAARHQAVQSAFGDAARTNAAVLGLHRGFLSRFDYALGETSIDASGLAVRTERLDSLGGVYTALRVEGLNALLTLDERQQRWTNFLTAAQALRASPETETAQQKIAAIEAARSGEVTVAFLATCRVSSRDCPSSNITDSFESGAGVYFNVGIASPGSRSVRYDVADEGNQVVDAGRSFDVSRSTRYRINYGLDVPGDGAYTLRFFNGQGDLIGRHRFTVGG